MRRLVPIVLISASAAACTTEGGESIIVLKNAAPSAGCQYASTESEQFISHGLLDIAQNQAYTFGAQLRSRVLTSSDVISGGTAGVPDIAAKTIFLRSANIDLKFPNSVIDLSTLPANLTHFKALFSAVLPPEGLTDAPFDLIPADLGKEILKRNGAPPNIEVEATFTVIGDLGGDQVSSQAFVFPVTLGVGITQHVAGMCPLPAGSTVRTGGNCGPAQDGVVDCCMDPASSALVCPATIAAM